MFGHNHQKQEEEKMRKNVKKVIAPLLAAAMVLSCTVCVSAAEDETIKLTVWGAEEGIGFKGSADGSLSQL